MKPKKYEKKQPKKKLNKMAKPDAQVMRLW
jgi:hypothetical protein